MDVETEHQYQHSLRCYKSYFISVKPILGNHYSREIEDIVANVTGRITSCGNHHFIKKTTFRAKSSSIAEANNAPMKRGSNPVRSNMSLATSAHVQLQNQESKDHKRNVLLAQRLNNFSTFSQSAIKDIITDFMDLCLCDMFDNRHKVTAFYIGNGQWKVISKSQLQAVIDSNEITSIDTQGVHPRYINVRTVKIVNNHMTCSCGMVHAFQAPCIHIICILDDPSLITPAMIPIRWWYVYQYYHNSKSSIMAPNIDKACKSELKRYRKEQFNETGEFVGINMHSCSFDLSKCVPCDTNDPKWIALQKVMDYMSRNQVLVKNSKAFLTIGKVNDIATVDIEHQDLDVSNTNRILS